MKCFMRVPTALCATRHIVQIIDALYIERNMLPAFYEREISTAIVDYGEANDLAVTNAHKNSTRTLPSKKQLYRLREVSIASLSNS